MPAFLISLAAGLLVTRSSHDSNLPAEFLRQLFSRPQALAVAGGFLAILIFTSLPRIPLLLLGAGCVGMAVTLSRRSKQDQAVDDEAKKQAEAAKPAEERVEDYLAVDPMEVEIGVGLIRLADPKRGGDLLERIQRVRQNVAAEIGMILPKVRIRDNMRLEQNQYRIKIADMPVAEGTVYPEHVAGDRFRHDHRQDARHRHQGAGLRHARRVDRSRHARSGRDARLHRGRAGQRDRHASDRDRPPARRRNAHPRRRRSI